MRRRSFGEIYSSPRSVRMIETIFWRGLTCPRNLRIEESVSSPEEVLNEINSVLRFRLTRTDPETLKLSCTRHFIREEPRDNGYFIKFYISLFNFEGRERSITMRFHQNTIDLDYKLVFYKDLQNSECKTLMKCLIRVVEMDNTSNSERVRQEQELLLNTRAICTLPEQISEMAYVLRRPDLGDVYTGRMDPSYASFMTTLITNACQYSRCIFEYIRARDRTDPTMPNIPLTEVLSGICHPQQVNEHVCTIFFETAHRLGLEFLRVLCSAYLTENLNNNNILKIITVADWIGDMELFEAAAFYFISNFSEICPSPQLTALRLNDRIGFLSMIRSLMYRMTNEDWVFPPLPEKEAGE